MTKVHQNHKANGNHHKPSLKAQIKANPAKAQAILDQLGARWGKNVTNIEIKPAQPEPIEPAQPHSAGPASEQPSPEEAFQAQLWAFRAYQAWNASLVMQQVALGQIYPGAGYGGYNYAAPTTGSWGAARYVAGY